MNKFFFIFLATFTFNAISARTPEEELIALVPSLTAAEILQLRDLQRAIIATGSTQGDASVAIKIIPNYTCVEVRSPDLKIECMASDRVRQLFNEFAKNAHEQHMKTVILPNLDAGLLSMLVAANGGSLVIKKANNRADRTITLDLPKFPVRASLQVKDEIHNDRVLNTVSYDLQSPTLDIQVAANATNVQVDALIKPPLEQQNVKLGYSVELDPENPNNVNGVNGYFKKQQRNNQSNS